MSIIAFSKKVIATLAVTLLLGGTARAQYVPVPDGLGSTVRGAMNQALAGYNQATSTYGTIPISPALRSTTLTASSATIAANAQYAVYYLNPTGAQSISLYAATAGGFQITFINLSSHTVTITPVSGTIDGLSTWQVLANESATFHDGTVGEWGLVSQSANGGGSGSPGGSSGSIQYNSAGSFAGASITGLVAGNGSSAPAEFAGTGNCGANEWMIALTGAGASSCTQPAFSNLSGNISVSQMNSGGGASSSTYWRGDGTWAAPSGGITQSEHSSTISTATSYSLQSTTITNEVFTFSATATVTLPQAAAGDILNGYVCQNGTGGFTPTFSPISGLTISGTFPTFTTTASACGDFSLFYFSATQAYLSGSQSGPL